MKRVMQHFLFTSDPLGGLISHLTAKCSGNVHDKGVVEITASSLEFATHAKFAPRNAADFGTLFAVLPGGPAWPADLLKVQRAHDPFSMESQPARNPVRQSLAHRKMFVSRNF
jgi:hypothetical protein